MAIVIRKDLKLSVGKLASQVSHAVARSDGHADYGKPGSVKSVILSCKGETQLLNLYQKCLEAGIPHGLQTDTGINELDAGTPTVLCVGPYSEEEVSKLTKRLRVYKHTTF
jgi:PTH2 family peptidyl-tRNA hydrolase